MKKTTKTVIIAVSAVLLLGVVIFGITQIFKNGTAVSFSELSSAEGEPAFVLVTVSRRSGEQGSVTDLFEVTSEDRKELITRLPKIFSDYRYLRSDKAASSGDFIGISFAYNEENVLRFEVYADGTLLFISATNGGIYKIDADSSAYAGLYTELYEYITEE